MTTRTPEQMLKEANAIRRAARREIFKQVRAAVTFDVNSGHGQHHLDQPNNAYQKAMSLVSGLLDSFGLPSKPRLAYLGVVKHAEAKDGVVTDGIIRVGATIQTLTGHKAQIDIPVIVKERALVEPAVFYYGGAPYVMCGPAIAELVKRGTLMRDTKIRSMFAPPMPRGVEDSIPRQPIINRHTMFNPGSRNPWKFRRFSGRNEQFQVLISRFDPQEVEHDVYVDVLYTPEYKPAWNGLNERFPQPTDPAEVEVLGATMDGQPIKLTPEEEGRVHELAMEQGHALANEDPRDRDASKKVAHGENKEAPSDHPELWKGDVQDEMLDPAERRRNELLFPGDKVSLKEDYHARYRGGASLRIPRGQEGVVLRDLEGDGKMLAVQFGEMDIKVAVPKHLLKVASTSDQVRNEIRAMLREGYQTVDIVTAIKKRFPQHAEEALQGLQDK